VDDEAGDGADVAVDEVLALFGRELGEIEGAVARVAVEAGVGEDSDGDGCAEGGRRVAADDADGARFAQIGGEVIAGLVADGPDLGEGGGWAGDVVEALERFIVGAGTFGEDEAAGNEARQDLQLAICDLQLSRRVAKPPLVVHIFPLLFSSRIADFQNRSG